MVSIDCRKITDATTFHAVFAAAFGFPDFYGANMDAWVDCMSCVDDPEAQMTSVHCAPGAVMTVQLEHASDFRSRLPELFISLVDVMAFVNWRRNQTHEPSVLALSYNS